MYDDFIPILVTLVIRRGFGEPLFHQMCIFISASLNKIKAGGFSEYGSTVQMQTESAHNIRAAFNCLLAL